MPDADRETINELQLKFLRLKDARTKLEMVNKNVTELFCPARGRYPGDDFKPDQMQGMRMDRIIDSATMEALEVAQNGMHSGLTPPSSPWFRLAFEDSALNRFGPARNWLDMLQKVVYTVLARSGFYSNIHSTYGEVLSFSTGAFTKQRDPNVGLCFDHMTFGEYWISSSALNKVDTFARSRWFTAKQIVQGFGEDRVSKAVKDDYSKPTSQFNAYELIHFVQPRINRNPDRIDSKNMPFMSVWFENQSAAELGSQTLMASTSSPHMLRESGYKRFPYYVPRWNIIGSNMYGTDSPGMKQMNEARYLMDMKESMIVAVHKEVEPPVRAPTSLRGTNIRSQAGGVTYSDDEKDKLTALYAVKFNLEAGQALLQESRQAIKNGFFNNLFLMIQSLENQADRVTATQIKEMKAQGLLQIGPFVEHMVLEGGVMDQVVESVIDDVIEFHDWYQMPLPPQEVQGAHFKIVYQSILAQAQLEVIKQAIDETVNFAMTAEKVFPEAADLIFIDEAIRERADIARCPARVIRSEEEVQAIRDRRKQEQEKQEQLQMLQMGAKGAQTLARSPTDPKKPNLLTSLASAMQGGGGEEGAEQ